MGLSWFAHRAKSFGFTLRESDQTSILLIRQKDHTKLNPIEVRTIAKVEALDAIEIQKKDFLDLGIMGDWDSHQRTYRTMGEYHEEGIAEASQILILRYGN